MPKLQRPLAPNACSTPAATSPARGSRLCARMSSTIWHSCRSCWKPYNVHLTTSDLQKSEVVFVLAGLPSQSRIRSPDSPFCRCATSSPGPGEVFPQRGSLWRNRKLCVDCQGLPLWGKWMRPAGADGEGEAVRLHHISFPFMPPASANLQKIHSKTG